MADVSKVTTGWMAQKYAEFNEKYFGGQLPRDCKFSTDMSTKHWGYATARFAMGSGRSIITWDYNISMTNAYSMTEETKVNTLIHEMIHILDYLKNPHYYGYYDYSGKFHRNRYDAHGELFFIPEAKRLTKFGFNITKLVTADEMESSELDASIAKRMEKKRAKGYILGYLTYVKNSPSALKGNGMMFKTTPAHVDELTERARFLNKAINNGPRFSSIEFYHTSSPEFENWAGCRGSVKGWLRSKKEWEEILERLGDNKEFVKHEIFIDEGDSTKPVKPKNEIPLFRMRLTNGKTIELRNKTKKEIEHVLREQFPKASDEAIQKIMNNKTFFPMSEQRVTITESDIKDMVNEVIANIGMDQFDDIDNEKSYVRNKDGSVTISMA